MIRIFRSYHPAIIFLLLLYVALFRVSLLFFAVPFVPPASSGYLSTLTFQLLDWVIGSKNYIYHLVALALVFFQALYFNFMINQYRILSRPSYVPALSYVLISSLLIEFTLLTPALMANTFLLFACSKILSCYRKERVSPVIFDAALLVSIASLFFFPYIVFFLFVIASLMVLRPFSIREYFFALTGLVLPYYFIGVYFFWNHRLNDFWQTFQITQLNLPLQEIERSSRVIICGVSILFVLLWNLFFVQSNLMKMVVQVRSSITLFILFFFAGIFSLLIQFNGELDHFIWLAVPAGLAFSLFFVESRRRWMAEIFHFLLLLSALFFQYYYLNK